MKSELPASIRLIIFDWDGTLMDSEAQIVTALQASIHDLELDVRSAEQCRDIIGLGLREAVDALYPGSDDALLECFVERYRYHWFSNTTGSQLFAGARETLALLKQSGILLAVATGKGRAGLDMVLDHTGLANSFAATRCSDETCSKPHPQMLLEILEELQVDPAEALMVGDTEYDMQMASNAGVGLIGVSYGVHERDRLEKHGLLNCLDCVSDLVGWLVDTHLLEPEYTKKAAVAGRLEG